MTRSALTVLFLLAACGKSSTADVPVYTDALAGQVKAVAPNCVPVPANSTAKIRETLDCSGQAGQIGVRLTDGRKLWSMTISLVGKSAAEVKPTLRAVLTGFVSPKAIETIEAHLDDPAKDLMDDGTRISVDGVEVMAVSRKVADLTRYETHLSWAFRR